ncbi:MAG: preprotein translocase subunit SecE [Candidatus Omnitrophica bacterium]|nr:preprotein translocase subunit SecE [Candidatus Omnitrophota bacterium]
MIRRVSTFVQEVRTELGKVSWSSRQDLIGSTWVVLASTTLLAVVVGTFDFICTTLIRWMVR